MKAEDVAAYFMRRIAKPIAFDIRLSYDRHNAHRFYVIEPTAVRDLSIHVIVAFKHCIESDGSKRCTPRHYGEAEIPLVDGDTVGSVLDMAIAQAVFGDKIHNVSRRDEGDKIVDAHTEVRSRLDRVADRPGPPRI
jgi:hypothetical protein